MRLVLLAATAATALALGGVSTAGATPITLVGTDGPGFHIVLTKSGKPLKVAKPGSYSLTVSDKSSLHNFHIFGPGLNKVVTTIAPHANSTVAGMRSKMSCTAGILCENERPRSPLNALVRKSQYCAHIGLSSPSAAVARAISAWSAWGLIRMSIGLPIANTPMNTSSDMTKSTTMLCISRRIRKTVTARRLP